MRCPKCFPTLATRRSSISTSLELQTVVADHDEGWDVSPGKIAFSHAGYAPGTTKTAVASGLAAHQFSLIEETTGKVIFTGPVENRKTDLGTFQVLDFSSVQRPEHLLSPCGRS